MAKKMAKKMAKEMTKEMLKDVVIDVFDDVRMRHNEAVRLLTYSMYDINEQQALINRCIMLSCLLKSEAKKLPGVKIEKLADGRISVDYDEDVWAK